MTTRVIVTLGRLEFGGNLVLDLAQPWHIGIQGGTRSGKSVLLDGLLAPLAGCRSVVVAGSDPSAITLNAWRDHPRSDFRALGCSDLDKTAMVMDAVVREMDGRIVGLLASDRDKLDDFTADLPLLVVVMEEYPGLLGAAEAQDAAEGRKPAERLASRLQRNVRRLIQEGAKVGVRVILVAQRMDAATVGGAERSNLGARFTLRVDNADAVKMLHPNASLEQIATVSGFDPGTGLVEMPGIPLQRFKADYLDYGNYSRVVREASR